MISLRRGGSLFFQLGGRREEAPSTKDRESLSCKVLRKRLDPTKFLQLPLGVNINVVFLKKKSLFIVYLTIFVVVVVFIYLH